jgi:hypothetical protein
VIDRTARHAGLDRQLADRQVRAACPGVKTQGGIEDALFGGTHGVFASACVEMILHVLA